MKQSHGDWRQFNKLNSNLSSLLAELCHFDNCADASDLTKLDSRVWTSVMEEHQAACVYISRKYESSNEIAFIDMKTGVEVRKKYIIF